MKKKNPEKYITTEELKAALGRLQGVYQNEWFLKDENSFREWARQLGEYTNRQVNMAISYWIQNNRNAPLPSDLIAAIEMSGTTEGHQNPFEWPIWLLQDTSNGRIMDSCFAPPIMTEREIFDWFKRNRNNMFSAKIVQTTYEDFLAGKHDWPAPQKVPDGYETWYDWCKAKIKEASKGGSR